jgi:NADPH:quinone reductase-like Zn-dependent oxidoreductase
MKATPESDRMTAITQHRYGSADVLELTETSRPVPKEGEVLVRVAAAGMDRGAWHFMTGQPYLMRVLGFGLRAPRSAVPGTNFAGTVVALGPGVDGFAPGDEVYGVARGTFAEYLVAKVGKIAHKPDGLTVDQAAVLPYPSFVSMQALHDKGQLRPGQSVLVVGASGAVGTVTVQMAAAAGAVVSGVCSGRHQDLVRSLGAHEVIDYQREDFADGSRRFDLIIDIGGRTSVRRLRRALKPRGTLVIVGGEGGRLIGGIQRQLWASTLSLFVKQKLITLFVRENADELQKLNVMVDAGQVFPTLGRTFSLREAPAAVRAFERADSGGRVLIRT